MDITSITSIIIGAAIGIVVGGIIVFLLQKSILKGKAENIIKEAEADGEARKKDKILQAKERFLQLKDEHEKAVRNRERSVQSLEDKTKSKDKRLNHQLEEINRKNKKVEALTKDVESQVELIEAKKSEIIKLHQKQVNELSKISGYSPDEAKATMMNALKDEARTDAMAYIKDIVDEAKINASGEAKKIVVQAIQRVATEQAIENSVSIFRIESDEMKGRIIGREGRNIRALEAATGVEIIVDDTPEAIILSCFDSVRREVARLALHQLVSDGRIHPARIEEVVAKTRKSLNEEIVETGRRTCIDLGIHGLHPELMRMVGRMKYRSSYGQNLLQHSREVANLCAIMAAELGLNVKIAKRAGLLHDIGKVSEDEPELPHAILGMKLAEKHGEKPDVCNAIGAHHDEIEMTTLISPIVQVCDAVSGARPGARREIAESYIKRIKELETTALGFDGVIKSYAIQAGRELRVMVESEKVNDQRADELSFIISQKIQNEMTYPGQVKVTVIRESRAVHYAK